LKVDGHARPDVDRYQRVGERVVKLAGDSHALVGGAAAVLLLALVRFALGSLAGLGAERPAGADRVSERE
jgi:hypothetical protein